jgi:carboxylesterase
VPLVPFAFVALVAVVALLVGRALNGRRFEREVASRFRVGADGIIVGAEAIALERAGAPTVLLLHGFGDTPQTVRYLAEHLHDQGYAVYAPLLPGHGRTLRDFAASDARQWESHARSELERIAVRSAELHVVGLSMGGAIAAALVADGVPARSLTLVAPYMTMPPRLRRLARMHGAIGALVPYARGQGARSIHDATESAKNLAYGILTPRLLRELERAADRGFAALPRLTTPTLMLLSREDNRIAPDAGERVFAAIGSTDKRMIWLEECGHILTVDFGREKLFAEIERWIASHGTTLARVARGGA